MPLPFVAAGIVAGLGAILRQVFGGVVIAGIFSWIKKAFTWVFLRKATGTAAGAAGKRGVFGKIFGFFETLLNGAAMLTIVTEGIKRLVGYIGIGGAVVSGGANVNQVWHLLENINDPQSAVLDWLSEALAQLPSLNQLISQIDSAISSSHFFTYITPVPTVTSFTANKVLQVPGKP